MRRPHKIGTVHVEKLDNELCIYNWQRMEVHTLNPTAALVWELCDGQTSPAQIAKKLPTGLSPTQAEELVWLTLTCLAQAHLLQEAVVKPSRLRREAVTRRQLLKGLGMATVLLPVIHTIVAPGLVEAQSPQPATTPTPTPVPREPLAYVTNTGEATVSVIDTISNMVSVTIPVGNAPRDVAVVP